MPEPTFMLGEDVTLNPPGEEDVQFLTRLMNHPEVWPSLKQYDPKTEAIERSWLESIAESDDVHLLICVDDKPQGIVGLNDVDHVWGVAELGYAVLPEAWDNGYATDAARRVVRYGFEDLRLHRVEAQAHDTNPASQRVLEKVGFDHEGVARERGFARGERVDLHQYGLLAEEFE